jgi:threonine/homoserine/homoserine lactone efflux protein
MEEAKTQNKQPKRSKLTSAKLWVTLWAIAMVSFIVIANRSEFMTIAQWLCAVPLAYIGANVWQKKIYEDSTK